MTYPYLGFGLGLRTPHYDYVLENQPPVDWFEVLTENYLVPGGKPLWVLDQIRAHYPIVMHGVSLSIGSMDPLNTDYLKQLKALTQRVEPAWISDHLCWTGVQGKNAHDLMPLPYTEEALQHVVDRVKQVQDYLGRQILLENVSSYVTYAQSAVPEWEFFINVTKQADCLMLLDINNIYVSAFNHGFDAETYLNAVPVDRVQQFHLAGHTNLETHLIDTHDHPVCDPVWDLYRKAVQRFGDVSTMIERDDDIPEFDVLMAELTMAKEIAAACHPGLDAGSPAEFILF
ncbi:MAG: UPF0276 protein [marine bacterium B5-7]|nr:MAG: UPF0276 protein [marine bacterium B5-7]